MLLLRTLLLSIALGCAHAIGNWRLCRGTQCCDALGYTGCYVSPSGSAAVGATSLSFDSIYSPSDPVCNALEEMKFTR